MAKKPPLYPHVTKSQIRAEQKAPTQGVARADIQAAMSELKRAVFDLLDVKDEIRGFADKPATPETREQLGKLHEKAQETQSKVDELFQVAKAHVYLYY